MELKINILQKLLNDFVVEKLMTTLGWKNSDKALKFLSLNAKISGYNIYGKKRKI